MKLRIANESGHTAYAKERSAVFAARCRDGGLAVTPQRTAMIEALLASTDAEKSHAGRFTKAQSVNCARFDARIRRATGMSSSSTFRA